MTWRKRTIMEMAQEAGMSIHSFWAEQKLEAFAALVREEATAEANARANASWTLMCKKMVAIEREECEIAIEELLPDADRSDCVAAIRARGQA